MGFLLSTTAGFKLLLNFLKFRDDYRLFIGLDGITGFWAKAYVIVGWTEVVFGDEPTSFEFWNFSDSTFNTYCFF